MTAHHPNLRLTPSNSPFFKANSPRSPTRSYKSNEEPGLRLRKVVGSTTTSPNAFDFLASARCFACTAGAAAVVASIDENLQVTQRFFRARPAATNGTRDSNPAWATSPSPFEPKQRALGTLREQTPGSPLALSTTPTTRDWSDSPTGRTTTGKDRVKAATSVALSANGRWLAVGETGYKPRVLIFSLSDGSSEAPSLSLSEHMYGVHCLSFSPDSRYLASLGTVNDGFLHLWTVNDRTGSAELFASNKVTTLVNSMTWMGRSVVTVGLRFVKVWRPEDASGNETKASEPASNSTPLRNKADNQRLTDFGKSVFSPRHKTLAGKNALLGDLLDCNFISVLAMSETKAVVCAESGEICLLDDTGKAQNLSMVALADFPITAARLQDDRLLVVLGADGQSKRVDLTQVEQPVTPTSRSKRQSMSPIKFSPHQESAVISTAALGDVVVELSFDRVATLRRIGGDGETTEDDNRIQMPAHKDAVLGVIPVNSQALPSARFLTYSGDGTIHFWDVDGNLVTSINMPLQASPDWQQHQNEIKAVVPSQDGECLIVGDKYGVVAVVDVESAAVTQLRAHSAEILDITTAKIQDMDVVATAGRDRMVQLFTRKEMELTLLQTLDEHAGAVSGVLFQPDGRRLISYSADRSVVIREIVFRDNDDTTPFAFVMHRTIALKSSPTSISLASDDHVLVAAVDRCISRYAMKDGHCAHSFKCADNDGGEAVVMSKILYIPSLNGTPCIAGVCSSDKSVRLYAEYGTLLARDWGHTEGITDMAVLLARQTENEAPTHSARLITVAADSTMFVWDAAPSRTLRSPSANGSAEPSDATPDISLAPPLRKVISHTELSRFRRKRSADESEPPSPTTTPNPNSPSSPQRVQRKTSRASVAQPPRLEPSSRAAHNADGSRRKSQRYHRSPSPPSPRAAAKKRDSMRRRSMANMRSKSSDNVAKDVSSLRPEHAGGGSSGGHPGFGSLAASTESVCRTLRAYRKKLSATTAATTATHETALPPAVLAELEKELKLTVLMMSERVQGKAQDARESSEGMAGGSGVERCVEPPAESGASVEREKERERRQEDGEVEAISVALGTASLGDGG